MQKTPKGVPLHLPNNQQQWLIKSAILTVIDVNIIILLISKYICLQCIHRKNICMIICKLIHRLS